MNPGVAVRGGLPAGGSRWQCSGTLSAGLRVRLPRPSPPLDSVGGRLVPPPGSAGQTTDGALRSPAGKPRRAAGGAGSREPQGLGGTAPASPGKPAGGRGRDLTPWLSWPHTWLVASVASHVARGSRCRPGQDSHALLLPAGQRHLLKWSVPLGHVTVVEYGHPEGAAEHPPEHLAVAANAKPRKGPAHGWRGRRGSCVGDGGRQAGLLEWVLTVDWSLGGRGHPGSWPALSPGLGLPREVRGQHHVLWKCFSCRILLTLIVYEPEVRGMRFMHGQGP